MGNHCIDCEFCGQDQRIVGPTCCPEYVASKAKKAADQKAEQEANDKYLSRYGLRSWDGRSVNVRDVVAVLKKFEGKLLKPGRVKKPDPPSDYDGL